MRPRRGSLRTIRPADWRGDRAGGTPARPATWTTHGLDPNHVPAASSLAFPPDGHLDPSPAGTGPQADRTTS